MDNTKTVYIIYRSMGSIILYMTENNTWVSDQNKAMQFDENTAYAIADTMHSARVMRLVIPV